MEFRYVAVNSNGRRVTGRYQARNQNDVKVAMKQMSLHLVSCKPVFGFERLLRPKLPKGFLIEFSRQMSILLSAGISVIHAFQVLLSEQSDKRVQICISQLLESVHQGCSLARAMEQNVYMFDQQYINTISIGEESGHLINAFEQNFTYLSDKQALTRKIKQASTYPLIVMVTALLVITLLLIKVIPSFQSLFANFDQELPVITQFVITLSFNLKAHWLTIIITVLVLGACCWFALLVKQIKYYFDKYKLSAPIFGTLFNYYFYTWFALSCHNLLKAGVPLHAAIAQLNSSTNNSYQRRALRVLEHQLKVGISFHHACSATNMFPAIFTQLVQVGENSGTLDMRLLNLANMYQSKLDDHISQVVKLIEPTIMLVTGVIIGGLVLVMYLPIFQMSAFL